MGKIQIQLAMGHFFFPPNSLALAIVMVHGFFVCCVVDATDFFLFFGWIGVRRGRRAKTLLAEQYIIIHTLIHKSEKFKFQI